MNDFFHDHAKNNSSLSNMNTLIKFSITLLRNDFLIRALETLINVNKHYGNISTFIDFHNSIIDIIMSWYMFHLLWIINENRSISLISDINKLFVQRLTSIQNFIFIWVSLTGKWHHVTFLWKINEDLCQYGNYTTNKSIMPNFSFMSNYRKILQLTYLTFCPLAL